MRNSLSNYRYAFQGQELDSETNMEAFQLRLWDGRIGRWLSPDPYHEFDSPYLGMGNNPVSTIDPDGGCTKCPKGSKDNPIQLQEVVVYSTRVTKPRDISKDLSFVPKAPIFDFAIAPRYSDDFFWNKSPFSYNRSVEYSGPNDFGLNHYYTVNYEGYAIKRGGIVPQGGAGALEFINGGGVFKAFSAYKSAITVAEGGGRLSRAGIAISKHPNILRLVTTEIITTNSQRNHFSAEAIKFLMRNGSKSSKIGTEYGKAVKYIDYKLPSGLGVRFYEETNTLKGFLGRGL